ncbi:TetR family transcriptional regulator (plasmid) [Mycolicibacterium arabiense]|uniref:TetR family transcriptional regulator n=2 Tax=Mycolicibacterium arabiense TaxID=1286181 RepID=A0A7I7RS19_9MYCO|nr:TetR family transcriptional regulator [Mycolicibacterium arabiense]BBY46789.1 TetR family transcriptional regulator [Mycolicibacterium arabiense]
MPNFAQTVTAEASESRVFTAKGLATRERILHSAAAVLLAEGLMGFSVDRVRAEASVSGSQMSHYFADRQELVRAVVERRIERVLDFHRQPQLGGLDTFEEWERWSDLNVRHLRRIGHRGTATYHVLVGQLARYDEATREIFASGYLRWVTLLEDSFARMKSRGVIVKSAEPRQLAWTVVSLHQGAGVLANAFRDDWPLADVTRFVVDYLRLFATDAAERTPRPLRRTRRRRGAGTVVVADGGPRFTEKGLATRARIVEGAAELMFERGVAGTSLDDVRTVAGVSGSQMSHYFADRRDLTRHVIAARTEFVIAFHRQPELGGLDSLRSLRAWADSCRAQAGPEYSSRGCVYGSLTGELLEADDATLNVLAAGYDRWLAVFEDGLSVMRERGDLVSEADPRRLAVALVAAHQGGTMVTHVAGSGDPFRTAVGATVDYVAALAPTAGRRRRPGSRSKKV